MLLFFRALFFDVGAPNDRRSLRWPAMCDAFHSLSHSSGKLSFWTFRASHEIRGARRADLGMQGVDRKPAFNPAKKTRTHGVILQTPSPTHLAGQLPEKS